MIIMKLFEYNLTGVYNNSICRPLYRVGLRGGGGGGHLSQDTLVMFVFIFSKSTIRHYCRTSIFVKHVYPEIVSTWCKTKLPWALENNINKLQNNIHLKGLFFLSCDNLLAYNLSV